MELLHSHRNSKMEFLRSHSERKNGKIPWYNIIYEHNKKHEHNLKNFASQNFSNKQSYEI